MDKKTVLVAVVSAVLGAVLAAPLAVYASHAFVDVPSSNTFHNDIAWLADAGVTKGCNPPANTEFCPTEDVSREQMAAFMRRFAQFLDAEDGTPALADRAKTADKATTATKANTANSATTANKANAANAATTANSANNSSKLQGYTAKQLAPRTAFNSKGSVSPDTSPYTLPTSITAPARGTLSIVGGGEMSNEFTNGSYACYLQLNGAQLPGSVRTMESNADLFVNEEMNCATNVAVVVNAGTHSVGLTMVHNGDAEIDDVSLQVTWTPFNGSGNTP